MIIKDQSGAALPLTIVVILALTLLGVALFAYFMAETDQVARDENNMKAHYIARSGAHAVAISLIHGPDNAEPLILSPESDDIEFAGGHFNVLVYGHANDEIHIESVGTFDSAVQKVMLTVRQVGVDFALYGQTINVDGKSSRISGGSVVYGTSIDMDPVVIDEDQEIIELDRDFDPVILPCEDIKSFPEYYGACPTYNNDPYEGEIITEDSLYGKIRLQGQIKHLAIEPESGQNLLLKAEEIDLSNNEMTVKLDNNKVIIVVDNFKNSGNSRVFVEGNGYLMFYVKNYTGGGNFQLEPDSDVNVNVFVQTGGTFDLGGTPNFEGAIYAPHAAAVLVGNTTVTGWIIADEAELGGNVNLYYSPIDLGAIGFDLTFYKLEKWRYDN